MRLAPRLRGRITSRLMSFETGGVRQAPFSFSESCSSSSCGPIRGLLRAGPNRRCPGRGYAVPSVFFCFSFDQTYCQFRSAVSDRRGEPPEVYAPLLRIIREDRAADSATSGIEA